MARTNQVGRHATAVGTENGYHFTQYHSTKVVMWNDKEILLNSNGWHTATTKLRMNQTSNQFDLGFVVWQKDFAWYVDYKGKTFDYFDAMVLNREV